MDPSQNSLARPALPSEPDLPPLQQALKAQQAQQAEEPLSAEIDMLVSEPVSEPVSELDLPPPQQTLSSAAEPEPPSSAPAPLPTSEEFNELSSERTELLGRLQTLLGQDSLPKHFVAALFFCDIHQLEKLVGVAEDEMFPNLIISFLNRPQEMMKACKLKSL